MGTRFELVARRIEVPEGATPNDFLFHGKEERLMDTNHADQLVVVEGTEGRRLEFSYDMLKAGLRSKYAGRTIFAVVHNIDETVRHFGRCEEQFVWVVAAYGTGVKAKVYFYGDAVMQDAQADAKKVVRIVRVPCIDERGKYAELLFMPKDAHECDRFVQAIQGRVDAKIVVQGMDVWLMKKQAVDRAIFVTSMEFEEETYEWVVPAIQKVKGLEDVVVWRDLMNDIPVPSQVEAFIITASLMFSYEGYAAINLFIIGRPSSGKSHQLDTFAYLMGTVSHNMGESTPKGLVYSHSVRGKDDLAGKPGILYRERDVALLNEFMRLIGDVRASAQGNDESRRLLSALNDAVEKKRNRSRSSGTVTAAGTVVCSIMTSDNYYPAVIKPFLKAMIEDASYIRRYAYLRLEKETETRGSMCPRPANWRSLTDALLVKKGLSQELWRGLMRYWRSLIPKALQVIPETRMAEIREFAKDTYRAGVMRAAGATVFDVVDEEDMSPVLATVLDGDMRQNAEALLVCAVIMKSTFVTDGLVEEFVCGDEEMDLAKAAITRLINDLLRDMRVLLLEEMQYYSGVRRT